MFKPSCAFCWWMLILLLAGGCGKKEQFVESNRTGSSGTVTLDGKPLIAGSVTFVSIENPMYTVVTGISSDGSFSVINAPKGPVRVAVETESNRIANPKLFVPIPAKYANPNTSKLTATITPGGPPVTIELKSR